MVKVTWEKQTHRHAMGSWAKLGSLVIGSVVWTSGSRNDETPRWAVVCQLPGLKPIDVKFWTEDEAKARFEKRVEVWFDMATAESHQPDAQSSS